MPIILDPFNTAIDAATATNSKSVLVEAPDHALVNPATFAASTNVSPAELVPNPCKRQLSNGAWIVVSNFIPLGEVHLMKGSTLVAVLQASKF